MKYRIILFGSIMIYLSFIQNEVIAQNNPNFKHLIQLGKDSLIQQAIEWLGDDASLTDFKKVEVKSNGKEILVSFLNPIKYIPQQSAFYYDVHVYLIENSMVKSPCANPVDSNLIADTFFKPSEDSNQKIKFVIDAINKNQNLGQIGNIDEFEYQMIIRENEQYYEITIWSTQQESEYKIDKISGKVFDEQHATLEPNPFNDIQNFEILNWKNE